MAVHAMQVQVTAPGAAAAAAAVRQVADRVAQLRVQQAQLRVQQGSSTAQTAAVRHGTALIQQQRAQLSLQQAQDRQERSSFRGSAAGKALSAISSTRVNLRPVSPLIGQTLSALSALGPEGMAAAAALAVLVGGIALAVHAAEKFADMIDAASKSVKEFADARIMSGGNTGNVAFFQAAGTGTGAAAGIRNRLASSPFAQAAGIGMGLGTTLSRDLQPGKDEAELEKNVIQGLARITDATERFQKAMLLDAVALLPAVEFYQRHADAVDKDAAAIKAINDDKGFQEAASDVQGNLERIKGNFMEVVVAFSKPFMKPVADFLERFANRLRDLAEYLDKNQAAIAKLRDGLVMLAMGFLNMIAIIGDITSGLGKTIADLSLTQQGKDFGNAIRSSGDLLAAGANEMAKLIMGDNGLGGAANKLSAAAGKLGDAATALHPGTYGGGDRTRRALGQRIPGIYPASMFDHAVAGGAYRLGAF